MSVRVAVFASGGGTNLQALIDRFRDDGQVRVGLVVSDRFDSGALRRAAAAGIDHAHIPVSGSTDEVAAETLASLAQHDVELVALAGYLRLIPAPVIAQYRGRILNVHPALLPAFGGKGMYGERVHAAVLEAGCRVSGATVHWVEEQYDEGGIIAQWPVPVLRSDTPASLGARILRVEHRLYPATIAAVARMLSHGGVVDVAAADRWDRDVFRLVSNLEDIEHEMNSISRL